MAWRTAILCALWSAASGFAQAGDFQSEDSVKAAFILRFATYVQWPEELPDNRAFVIAVMGSSDVAAALKKLAAGRALMNRPVQVRRINDIQDAADARVLYVGSDRRSSLRRTLAPLAGRSILVITSEDLALDAGSTINFLVADHRVRFETSAEAARLANLRISSELLSLAVRVRK